MITAEEAYRITKINRGRIDREQSDSLMVEIKSAIVSAISDGESVALVSCQRRRLIQEHLEELQKLNYTVKLYNGDNEDALLSDSVLYSIKWRPEETKTPKSSTRETLEIATKIIAAVEQGKRLSLASDNVPWNVQSIEVNKDYVRVSVSGDWSGGTNADQLATLVG